MSAPGNLRHNSAAPGLAVSLVLAFAAVKLLIHALTSFWRYGYFRDELYYIDCARHLAAGYVDMAPLAAFYAKLALVMGGSLPALRFLPALAGAGVIALTMYLAYELGGDRFAQALAGLCALLSPAILAMDVLFTMNAFEPLFWMGCIAVLIRIIQTGNSRLWLWFGVLMGLGLENKHSTVFFALAAVLGLLLSEHRRQFLKPWIWLAGAITLLVFLPNLFWQIQHHFPTLEDLENVRRMHKNVVLGPGAFVGTQMLLLHPILLPVWLAGLIWFFGNRCWRVLAWTFVVFFAVMFAMRAKGYYLFPIYPMLFAGGAVAIERWLDRRRALPAKPSTWSKVAIVLIMVIATVPTDIVVLPALSPPKYIAYVHAIHLEIPKTEIAQHGPLPQIFGDQFGWRELVSQVGEIYNSLPAQERARTGIFASNYGEAGALNFFGSQYGLPPAICAHQNHYFWGTQAFSGTNLIWLQWDREDIKPFCASVEQLAIHYHPYGMREENRPIYICRGLKQPLDKIWPQLKHWN